MKALSWTNFVLGLWLLISPFALGYSGTAATEAVIVGILIAALAFWRALGEETEGMKSVSWAVAVLGVWSIIAPFALGYTAILVAVWNDVIVGLIVAVLAATQALQTPHGRTIGRAAEHHGAH
jgi:hypothetical protein